MGFRGLGFRVWVQGLGGGVQLPIACFFVGYQGVLTCYFAGIGATGMGLGTGGGGGSAPNSLFFVGYQGVLTCYFAGIGATGMGLGI